MNKNYIPFAHASSIFDINIDFFKKLNIKTILTDLDNTLDSHTKKEPSKESVAFIDKLRKNGIDLIIVSNNYHHRVEPYANALGVKMTSMNMKPLPFKIKKLLNEKGLKKEEVILIGDQLLTDVLAGNRAGIKTILVDPLTKEDQKLTKIRRIFERPKIKKLRKKNLLKEWGEIYE
jgi:HAD superfamily phosphatase (TIGR01668 family)